MKEDLKNDIVDNFPPEQFNRKCNNLLSNGFDEYLTVLEEGVTHSIFTNTNPKSFYNRWIVDIYSDGRVQYSKQ